uniref:Bcl9 like n=1 Tax=Sinocyclocheilus grahami TaxID=75366 RepID=A0A672PBK7_SINGR
MGMVLQGGPQLSHDPSGPMLPSPNPMGMPGMTSVLPPQQMHLLSKGMSHQRPPHQPDSFPSMPMADGPDLSEVIRPTHTGIPEFDLSSIIPADKPSSTLQYFPKSEAMPQPHVPSSNPHIANLQNMMAEQQLPLHPSHSHCGMRGMGPICHPGHMMGRTGMSPQQQLQQHHHHQQQHPHNLMAQQNLMIMQAKQRGMALPGEHFGQQGVLMSPQGPMMGPPHSQSGMMGPQSLRQRSMSLNSPLGYGPGSMANMPF